MLFQAGTRVTIPVDWKYASERAYPRSLVLPCARMNEVTVRFTHAGWERATDYCTSCNTTWGELMFRLKVAAEGETPSPLFWRGGMAY